MKKKLHVYRLNNDVARKTGKKVDMKKMAHVYRSNNDVMRLEKEK